MFSPILNSYGLTLAVGASIVCQGIANSLIHIAEFNTVQESTGGWLEPTYALVSDWPGASGGTPQPVIYYNFVDSSVIENDAPHLYLESSNVDTVRNSQFHGGQWSTAMQSVNITNCLFERTAFNYWATDANVPSIVDNLFWNGSFKLWSNVTNTLVQNNLFDTTTFFSPRKGHTSQTSNAGFNAYVTNCNTLAIVSPTDVFLSNSPGYQASWFGNYYLPANSPLISKGSTNANYLGLYHFTSQTNQVIEGDSIVNIGYAYVATDAYGNPLDTNGDGIPDYLEDVNGNGIFDTGDFGDWQISPYGLNPNNRILVFTPLK
jgi:hypothetical protein